MKKNAFALSAIGATAIIGLAYFGHQNSDAQALSQLIQKKELDDANEIFKWLTTHYNQAKASDPVHPGESITSMLERPSRRLWCDEGAIVMSLLVQRQGKETRLVDLLDQRTGISHHTTMQVKEQGRWVTYDFTSKRKGIPLSATVQYAAKPRYRNYPESPIHWLLLNNSYARKMASWLRSLQAQTP